MSTSTRTQQSCANLRLTSRCRKLPQFSHAITLVVYGAVKSCANEPTDVNSLCLTIAFLSVMACMLDGIRRSNECIWQQAVLETVLRIAF